MTRCSMFISVAFLRTHSIITGIFHALIKEKPQTKSRKFWKFPIFQHCKFRRYFSAGVYYPLYFYVHDFLHCCSDYRCISQNFHTISVLANLNIISSRICFMVMGLFPDFFHIHIVIRWCSPNIQFHRTLQIISSGKLNLLKKGCSFIYDVNKVGCLYFDLSVFFLYPDFCTLCNSV